MREAVEGLAAFNEVGGAEYLRQVAREDPETFCAFPPRPCPRVLAGDEDNPMTLRVTVDRPESNGLLEQRESGDYSPQQLWAPQPGKLIPVKVVRPGSAR